MLVLKREEGERIYLSCGVWLTVVEVLRGKVRLGIEAPKEIIISREELLPFAYPTRPDNNEPRPAA